VENYSMQQPVGLNFPGIPDFMPMPSPDMPRFGISRPQEFNQYGYSAPQVRQQMGEGMNLQPSDDSIIDSSYLAQLGILNQPQVLSAQADALGSGQTGTLGSGLINVPGSGGKGGGAPLIQDYRGLANRFKSDAAAKSGGLMAATGAGDGGGGGSDYTDPNPGWTNMSDAEKAAYYAENPTMGSITRAGQKAFSYTPPGLLQSTFAPDFVADQRAIASGDGYFSSQGGGSRGESWQNAPADMGITAAPSYGQGYMADNSIEFGPAPSYGQGYMADNSIEMGPTISPGQGYMADNSIESSQGTNDGTYCCSRMVDLNLWSEHKQLARMHVWHHKQAKWWRAGYSVWGKVVANTLFKKKGFSTDVMDDFYNYHVKNKSRTLKSTVGDLVIYPGVAVCSLFVHEAPTTTRYVAQ
jgi:hypothetical protein